MRPEWGSAARKGGLDSIASTNHADLAKAEPYAANALKSLASGKPVEKASTKPYGYSVKYS